MTWRLRFRLRKPRAPRPARPSRPPLQLEALEERLLPSLTPQILKDINPSAAGSGIFQLEAVNGTVFFAADDGVHGRELWRSDGTVGGTILLADIRPGPAGSDPIGLTNVNGTVFFSASDGFTHGREL